MDSVYPKQGARRTGLGEPLDERAEGVPLRTLRRQETERRILDAVRELFRDPGFSHTTMEAIAERAGISRATLFNYFPTKQSLLLPFAAQVAEQRVRPQVEAALEPWPGVVAALASAFAATEEQLLALPDLRDALRDAMLTPHPRRSQAARPRTVLREILERADARGELRRDLSVDELTRYVGLLFAADLLGPRRAPGGDATCRATGAGEALFRFLDPALARRRHQRSRPTS